ncbi:MAG: tRNA-modifying protein YgfZ [Gammaproteobacteria bacterium]|nr:tRNA-modifying protein YgfZ [Gammaproteobacteria bacterium]
MSTALALSQFDIFPALPIGLIKLTGADSKKFLQGQLTCDLDLLSPQHSLLGAHCDPKGKALAIVQLLQCQDAILALQAKNNTASHLPNLKKYAVFSQVEITDASELFVFTGLLGEQASQWLTQHSAIPAENQDSIECEFGIVTTFPLQVGEQPRYLVISNEIQAAALHAQLPDSANTQSSSLWQALDILSGTPQVSPLISGEFVPQMLNMQMVEGISFTKGCYIGQETIARMHYRGINKRAMFILSSTSQLELQAGDSLERQVDSGWRNAGTIIASQTTENSTVILATLPIDSEVGCQMRVKNSDDLLTLTTPSYFKLAQ